MKLFERSEDGQEPKAPVPDELPIIPLKEMVVFPGMVVPFFVGKSASSALAAVAKPDTLVVLITQKIPRPDPSKDDFFDVGTVARVMQAMKLPDGSTRLLIEGRHRARVTSIEGESRSLSAKIETIEETPISDSEEAKALISSIRGSFRKLASSTGRKLSSETYKAIDEAVKLSTLVNLICGYSPFPVDRKIELLRASDQRERLEELAVTLETELETLDLKRQIQGRVRKRLEKSQRERYLQEQRKEIDRELGEENDDPSGAEDLTQRLGERDLPGEVRVRCDKELSRLKRLQPVSPEAGIIRTWLDWVADLPWQVYSHDHHDLDNAQKILDADHYDMQRPKERILDYLAVHTLKPDQRGPILCFVGPPGTGKTSLGASLARALGRDFLRISLGGVRDEAEIRGHRKTYVGALPGKIVQSLRKVGSANPVFLLDEIDKMSSDLRGDPASALLEALDPEQNMNFVDHYLEVPFDLSRVIFVTTANTLHAIPYALRDRMEIIEIPGYTEQEKTRIAQGFLIPKQLEANGLGFADITVQKSALSEIIRNYTAESGVRELERQIATVARKLARRAISEGVIAEEAIREEATPQKESGAQPESPALRSFRATVTPRSTRRALGKPRPSRDVRYPESRPGLARGLAWTERGGTLLPVEATDFAGSGQLILTGSLGDVMKESGRIALSFIRNHSHRFGLDERKLDTRDIHLHVPHGAIPKDGPSAGIALAAAMISALTGIPAYTDMAMTGEITLTGRILPVGGVKEKVLAALRNEVSVVLLPEGNRIDREELPPEVERGLELRFVESVLDALAILFPASLFEIRPR